MALAPSLQHPEVKDNYRLVALSTSNEESARETAAQYTETTGNPVKGYHGDVTQLVNASNVQLVAIAVRAPKHLSVALPAINAGKDVFLEWPAGRNLEEAKSLADAAKSHGTKLMVGLQGRHSAAFRKVISPGYVCNVSINPCIRCPRSSIQAKLVECYHQQQ